MKNKEGNFYAEDVYSDDEIQRINDEYDKKVAAGIFPDYSKY